MNVLKKIIFLLFILASIEATAQIPAYMSMDKIMEEGRMKLKSLESSGYKMMHMEYDLVFKGRVKETYLDLYSNRTFNIRAFGQATHIGDIDIKIYRKVDNLWTLVAQDNLDNREATISFQPKATERYKIEVLAFKFKNDYTGGKYGLMIYYR